ncbi:uncharacterized protein CEXT_289321 [Caerostris extrusa]|uniref:Uncharacterized protein n=1 Tax=Caerostris extrusa TaxID=172846 RepID=A0AAV4RP03_CAEEX|nr:uncharacterized protein CEXT_289321 [Caerostris extrusa]
MLEDPSDPSTARRKSMDPVSQIIHLEELPTPGGRFELQELLGVGSCARVLAATDKQKERQDRSSASSNGDYRERSPFPIADRGPGLQWPATNVIRVLNGDSASNKPFERCCLNTN